MSDLPFTANDLEPNASDKTYGMAAHLACWVPFLPLGLYYVVRNKGSLFKRFHSMQAMLWQFMIYFGYVAAWVLALILPCAFLILEPMAWILAALGPFWAIYAAFRAFRGHWYLYPLAGWSAQLKLGVPAVLIETSGVKSDTDKG